MIIVSCCCAMDHTHPQRPSPPNSLPFPSLSKQQKQHQSQVHWRAGNGGRGTGKSRTGASAPDIVIDVPPGTIVRTLEDGVLAGQLVDHGQVRIVCERERVYVGLCMRGEGGMERSGERSLRVNDKRHRSNPPSFLPVHPSTNQQQRQ